MCELEGLKMQCLLQQIKYMENALPRLGKKPVRKKKKKIMSDIPNLAHPAGKSLSRCARTQNPFPRCALILRSQQEVLYRSLANNLSGHAGNVLSSESIFWLSSKPRGKTRKPIFISRIKPLPS